MVEYQKLVKPALATAILASSFLMGNHFVLAQEQTEAREVFVTEEKELKEELNLSEPLVGNESSSEEVVVETSTETVSAEAEPATEAPSDQPQTDSQETPSETSESQLTVTEEAVREKSFSSTVSPSEVVEQPVVTVAQNGAKLDVSYNRVIPQTGKLLYAVWTEEKNQDDLRWYTASKEGDYSVDLSQYHRAYGLYNIHTYFSDKGGMFGLHATMFEVKRPKVTMTVVKQNDNEFQISLSGITSDISSVDSPIWTEKQHQDDLRWQNAKKEASGTYTTTIQLSQHNYESGKYLVHVYGQSKITGKQEGLLASSYVVKQEAIASKVTKGNNDYTVTLSNIPSYMQAVKVPIWSVRDGQDDIIWYIANKQANGSYTTTFNLSHHKSNIGDYAIHAYGQTTNGMTLGLLATTYKVTDLEVKTPAKYKQEQIVEIQGYATHESNGYYLVPHQNWIGKVKTVTKNTNNAIGGWEYHIVYDNGEQNIHVLEQDLRYVYHVDLKATNNRTQNNQALQTAFDVAKANKNITLYLPAGDYVIGSSITEEELSPLMKREYVLLSSNTKLRGNDKGTRLIVDGKMLWFGLPTGTNGIDGVSNLTIDNLHVRAKDEKNGNYFMVMLNHGNNIRVQNSSFTMVQKQSRHIFDLGGVQNAVFHNNKFIGYAPELTKVNTLPANEDLHKFYAETIQIDASNDRGAWDAGMIQRITPQVYQAYNRNTILSSNISILYNQFLPFYKDGQLVAYSSTVGQHSSEVGNLTIVGNRFEKTLSTRYKNDSWVMKPIHYVTASGYKAIVKENTIV
ncbi:GBS Bsp-like repeat-containing protein [Streptococcus suis]